MGAIVDAPEGREDQGSPGAAADEAVPDRPGAPRAETRRRRSRRLVGFVLGAVGVLVVAAIVLAVLGVFGSSDNGFADSFDRNDRATSVAPPGEQSQWSAVSGVWGIQAHAAYVSQPVPDANLLIARNSTGDGTVQSRLNRVAAGGGLVFRYHDPQNYWRVVAFPKVLTWQIERVEKGQIKFVANTGAFSHVQDGTTIAVRMQGENLDFLIDGKVRQSVRSAKGDLKGSAGLFTTGKAADQSRWDHFSFEPS